MLEQYLDFCDHLKIPSAPVKWDITIHAFSRILLPRFYVVLNIGATKKANLWTPDKFALLSDMIHDQMNMISVITGGPEDMNRGKEIESHARIKPVNLTGKTSLRELTGLLSKARGVVSCDTGPMHLAVALGTPTLGLFGPSNPRRTGPYGGEVIFSSMDCSPCNRRKCPNPECMARIDPEKVYKKLFQMIMENQDSPPTATKGS